MLFAKEQQYEPLSEGAGHDANQKPLATIFQRYQRLFIIGFMFVWGSITLYLTILAFGISSPHPPRFSSCGNTSTSARERGCSLDIVSASWQTPECFIEPLNSEFLSWKNWTWWMEKHGNVTVPLEDALKGDQDLWVTWEYHMVHCTFVWRQAQIGYERGWIDSHVRSYPHTLHCQHMLNVDTIAPDDNIVLLNVQYPICERVGTSKSWEQMDSVFHQAGDNRKHP